MTECGGETGMLWWSGHGMRQRTKWFRIQYLLCERINQQAIFSEKIDTQNWF
jgi:hypothetical protein